MLIARPCTENLDAMARTETGGFACSRCELEVVDLRRATRKRALTVLAGLRAEGGRVCARVRARPDGTPLFRTDPSFLGRFAAPVALASTLAACSPAASTARTATPITLSHASSFGGNGNGTAAPVTVAPTSRVPPTPAPSTANVSAEPIEVEMAGEIAW
jgi:hypothetical protein